MAQKITHSACHRERNEAISPLRMDPVGGFIREKFWWIVVVVVVAAGALLSPMVMVSAQSEAWAGVMAQGNVLYEAGDYDGAVTKYKEIIDGGVQNGRIYYNLGNAHFKTGQLGEAIVNYERARRLMPRDKDITANLRFARSQVAGQVDLPEESALIRWIGDVNNMATLDETLWWAWGIYWLISIVGLVAILVWRVRRIALYVLAVLGVVFVLSLISAGVKLHDARTVEVVVTVPEANVYSGPGEDYVLQFTVPEGTQFDVTEERPDWYRVRLGEGLEGWTPKTALTVI